MQVETLIERSIVEVDELNSVLNLYTSGEIELLKETIKNNAENAESMSVSNFVDMCTTLARI